MFRFEMDEPDGIVVVATAADGSILGFASAGPARDQNPPTEWELYAINVVPAELGSGMADRLITAAIAKRPATVWVVEDNARGQAFYRRHGFTAQATTKTHEGTGEPEIRMIRT